jgi:tetratricopeptide (TPR) repeat protein
MTVTGKHITVLHGRGPMEDTVCGSCGRGMSLRDLENNTFRDVDGQLLCPECRLKMVEPKKMRCPDCGAHSTVALEDGKYTCKQCGKELGGRAESGVIDSARPAANRDPEGDIAPARPTRSKRRSRKRSTKALGAVLAIFVAATVLLTAVLVRQHLLDKPVGPQDDGTVQDDTPPVPPKAKSPDERALEVVAKWLVDHPNRKVAAIKLFNEAIGDMASAEYKSKARGVVLELEEQIKAESDPNLKKIEALETQLAAAIERVKELEAAEKATPKPPDDTQPKPPDDTQPKPPDDTRPKPPDVVDKPEPKTVYYKALKESQKLVDGRKYGGARRVLDDVAAKLAGTEWARKATSENQRVRNDAYADYTKLDTKARELIAAKDFDGARSLYEQALSFGMPNIMRQVQEKLNDLQKLTSGTGETTTPAPPTHAIVDKLVRDLKSKADRVRADAAGSLGDIKATNAVPALIEALRDKAWLVRYKAAMSLGKLGDLAAVPALIDALGDTEEPVIHDAHRSLKTLTGQAFSDREAAKWQAWYREHKPGASIKPDTPPKHQRVFETKVLERRYDPDTIRIVVPKGTTVKPGSKVALSKDGKRACVLTVKLSAAEEASGEMSKIEDGVRIGPGSTFTATLPK